MTYLIDIYMFGNKRAVKFGIA